MKLPPRFQRPTHMLAIVLLTGVLPSHAAPLGEFTGETEIGGPKRAGSASFDSAKGAYTVSGGGANMWFTNDALHYVWKKVSGDVILAADIFFQGTGGDPHRKACLIIRQNLEKDGAYADAALHGDGLTSLQYREANGAMTREIQANTSGPRRLRLEKRGKYVSMSIAKEGEPLRPAGGAFRLVLEEPFYVGLGVCAHNDNNLETAVFTNVELKEGTSTPAGGKPGLISTLETITLSSKDRRVTWWTTNLIEAPNWSRDGQLYFNSRGRIYRVAATGGEPQAVDTGFATRCNSNHGLSPDGTQLVISDQSQGDGRSRIYTLPVSGGTPRLITSSGPSYWHGWSPDSAMLVYGAQRDGTHDLFITPAGGGPEMRLTNAKGLDDGPDYSPDGRFIYFHSDRTGKTQVWRMKAEGGGQEQVTDDEFNNWFPHPSPDGNSLVFLSYEPDVKGHPENKDVTLRVRNLTTGKTEVIAKLFGGQGTLNVPCWSPDSRKLAFVSYQLVP
jgi:Tol biopolymer transport system component